MEASGKWESCLSFSLWYPEHRAGPSTQRVLCKYFLEEHRRHSPAPGLLAFARELGQLCFMGESCVLSHQLLAEKARAGGTTRGKNE